MKFEIEYVIYSFAMIMAILSGQFFFALIILGYILVWDDTRWPAFDSDDYDRKMMNGSLKPWQKGI